MQWESIRTNRGKLAVCQHLGGKTLPTGFPGDLKIVPKEQGRNGATRKVRGDFQTHNLFGYDFVGLIHAYPLSSDRR